MADMSPPPKSGSSTPLPPSNNPGEESQKSSQAETVDSSLATDIADLRGPRTRYGRYLVVGLVVLAILVWLAGQPGGLALFLPWKQPPPTDVVESWHLLESRGSTALILAQKGAEQRIFVQKENQAGLLLVSGLDLTVSRPALSPDGKWVAYHSVYRNAILVTSLVSTTEGVIPVGQILRVTPVLTTELTLCDWTELAWSPDSSKLAFFACSKTDDSSVVFVNPVKGLLPAPTEVLGSESLTSGERDLLWLDQQKLIMTWPSSGQQTLPVLATLSAP